MKFGLRTQVSKALILKSMYFLLGVLAAIAVATAIVVAEAAVDATVDGAAAAAAAVASMRWDAQRFRRCPWRCDASKAWVQQHAMRCD